MAQKPNIPSKLTVGVGKDIRPLPTFRATYFPLIRKASMTFGICLMLALLSIFASRYYLHQQETNQQAAQTELVQAKEKYSEATNEKNNIRDYRRRYLALVEKGFIGEEKRLEVIELIRKIQENGQLFPITYTIAPQAVVTIDPSLFTSELNLFASRLTVNMGILHEMDVLTFIHQLREKATYVPQSCSMKVTDIQRDDILSPKLEVQCKLFLLTMNRRVVADESATTPME